MSSSLECMWITWFWLAKIKRVKKELSESFDLKDLGNLNYTSLECPLSRTLRGRKPEWDNPSTFHTVSPYQDGDGEL